MKYHWSFLHNFYCFIIFFTNHHHFHNHAPRTKFSTTSKNKKENRLGGREREEPERREKADCDVFSLSPQTGPHQNPQQLTPSLEERERERSAAGEWPATGERKIDPVLFGSFIYFEFLIVFREIIVWGWTHFKLWTKEKKMMLRALIGGYKIGVLHPFFIECILRQNCRT